MQHCSLVASSDAFLRINKSPGVVSAATAAWVLFQLLQYHRLTLVSDALMLSLALLLLWSNASKFIKGLSCYHTLDEFETGSLALAITLLCALTFLLH
ncbi:Reticulon-like protein [Ranunculus cassubicifolius]